MRVLLVLPTLSAGGAEGFIANLCVNLARFSVEVKVFLMAGVRGARGAYLMSQVVAAGCEVIGSEERNIRAPGNLFRLVRLIRTWRPHVVQANLYAAEVLVTLARLFSCGIGAVFARRLTNTNLIGGRSRLVARFLASSFEWSIACSDAVADAYRLTWPDLKMRQISVIRNGCQLSPTVCGEREKLVARRELNVPKTAFVVLHIGRMDGFPLSKSQKAHDVIIKAFARAFGGQGSHILLLVGDGPLLEQLKTLARELSVEEQVRFLGRIAEPWTVYAASDLFFFPSRHEGMPNVLPEAASCGLPVLAADIPEIRSIQPKRGWLLKPVDQVEAFAGGLVEMSSRSSVFRDAAVSAAEEVREEFSMTQCAERYLEYYSQASGLGPSGK